MMRKIKSIFASLMIFILVFSLSGCNFGFYSLDSLIRPPKLSGKYQGLQDSFDEILDNYSLEIPDNGDYQSAFVTFDIDTDSNEEAFVFYKNMKSSDIVNMYFFRYTDEKWVAVNTVEGIGSCVDKICFEDFDSDGNYEIIVGWDLFSSKTNKDFSVYNFNEDGIYEICNFPYSELIITDINGNGSKDIVTLTSETSTEGTTYASAKAYIYDTKLNNLALISETRTDGNLSQYKNINIVSDNKKNYLYIDCCFGDSGMFTDIVYWDDDENGLVAPLFDTATQSTTITQRNTEISCTDIDGDSILEIPSSVEMKGSVCTDSDDTVSSNILSYTKWSKFRNNSFTPVCYSVINEYFNYMLIIKSSWVGRITVISNDNQWDFYRFDSNTNSVGDLLFTINAYESTDTDSIKKYADSNLLKNSSNLNYVYSITTAGITFGVTNDIIENNFRIFSVGG